MVFDDLSHIKDSVLTFLSTFKTAVIFLIWNCFISGMTILPTNLRTNSQLLLILGLQNVTLVTSSDTVFQLLPGKIVLMELRAPLNASGGKSKAATSNCQRCFIFLPCHPENQFCNIVVFVTNKGVEKSYAAEVKGIFENAASIPGTSSICCI